MSESHIQALPRAAAAATLLSTLALLAPAAAADPVAYTHQGPNLARIDLATFDLEPVGPTGDVFTRWIAFHADGTLYGLDDLTVDSLRLVSYDPATGAGSEVGAIDLGDLIFTIRGFAGDACGGLWAVGVYLGEMGEEVPALLPIDPAAGTAGEPVDIQPIDPTSGAHVVGLAPFGSVLLAVGGGGVQAIDPSTGATWSLFPDAPGASSGMDVGPDGALWTLHLIPIGGSPVEVGRVDLTTGEVTIPGGALGIAGLAFGPPAGICGGSGAVAIPTLSPLALVVLAVSLVVAARWVRRRHA